MSLGLAVICIQARSYFKDVKKNHGDHNADFVASNGLVDLDSVLIIIMKN